MHDAYCFYTCITSVLWFFYSIFVTKTALRAFKSIQGKLRFTSTATSARRLISLRSWITCSASWRNYLIYIIDWLTFCSYIHVHTRNYTKPRRHSHSTTNRSLAHRHITRQQQLYEQLAYNKIRQNGETARFPDCKKIRSYDPIQPCNHVKVIRVLKCT